jgi:fatty-acyl-CoA synthase
MANLPTTDWCSKWALYSPNKTAFKEYETGRTLDFGELNRAADALSWKLTGELGLKKGERVAVLAEFCLEKMVLFSAAQKTGVILVPLNFRLAAPEIDFMLKNATPRLLFTEAKYQGLADAAQFSKKIPLRLPLDFVSAFFGKKEMPAAEPFPAIVFRENDPIFILYTSGSTGFPKGAMYTHKMLFWNSVNTAISLIVNSESRTLNFAPPFHTGGWNVLTTPFLHHGGYTCILKKFDARAVLELLQTERCTLFFGVPTMLKMLADEPGFASAKFPDLKYAIVGGEPMPLPLIELWAEKGVLIRQGYGMTEVGPNLTSLHQDDALRKRGSIGRPNFYVETRIADEQEQPCPPGKPGELWLRGPMVTPGYWRNRAASEKAFAPGGWFRTGDLVRQDDDGYLYVVDRIKNMFISGGENVYPAEIERILLTHPGVSESAVIGVADEKWGEVGRAFVVLKAGATAPETALLDYCREHLAKFKVPRSVVFLEVLPKNDAGKINRQWLRNLN